MNRNEFKETAKQGIDKIFARIDELEHKKDHAKAELKEAYNSQISKLKAEKSELKAKYENLLTISEDKWDDAKDSFEKASSSFKEGIEKVARMLN
ncbi:MAG: hypothetical protein DWQ44_00680 [Bacteroidetes bacterium]|nr:MAG: hypothetical protein DWQ33_04055 [Bacteroidota bacterium]REK07541.1 MAG: hypothetical protein DWQ39_01215 [Bacteroidota bacterium]REK37026.1 MAG: hypothetical protein DWQ44_00680 [Bacteroidota bacterium]REK47848.1 MAG: hypothetical protein DWQ48_11745 [Bacteroidota bacterium]